MDTTFGLTVALLYFFSLSYVFLRYTYAIVRLFKNELRGGSMPSVVVNYVLKHTFLTKEEAQKAAKEWQKKGYYTKIARANRNFELWVSEKQRWFYE